MMVAVGMVAVAASVVGCHLDRPKGGGKDGGGGVGGYRIPWGSLLGRMGWWWRRPCREMSVAIAVASLVAVAVVLVVAVAVGMAVAVARVRVRAVALAMMVEVVAVGREMAVAVVVELAVAVVVAMVVEVEGAVADCVRFGPPNEIKIKSTLDNMLVHPI